MKDTSTVMQQKQNSISLLLILLNIILGFVYVLCTPQHENDFFTGLFWAVLLAVILQALFVFTYKGNAPLVSKWLLGILLFIALCYGAFLIYASALGKAFQH